MKQKETKKNLLHLRGLYGSNYQILVVSIVIDSDGGHCYEHLKKKNLFVMKIERVTFI